MASSSARSVAVSDEPGALPGALDRAALEQHLFAQRQTDRRLHLMADQRQVDVEQVLGLFRLAGREQLIDLDQHLRPGEARHGAVGATA
jgi:hypothetical protein